MRQADWRDCNFLVLSMWPESNKQSALPLSLPMTSGVLLGDVWLSIYLSSLREMVRPTVPADQLSCDCHVQVTLKQPDLASCLAAQAGPLEQGKEFTYTQHTTQ